jgi:hypothetical protein
MVVVVKRDLVRHAVRINIVRQRRPRPLDPETDSAGAEASTATKVTRRVIAVVADVADTSKINTIARAAIVVVSEAYVVADVEAFILNAMAIAVGLEVLTDATVRANSQTEDLTTDSCIMSSTPRPNTRIGS